MTSPLLERRSPCGFEARNERDDREALTPMGASGILGGQMVEAPVVGHRQFLLRNDEATLQSMWIDVTVGITNFHSSEPCKGGGTY